MLFQPQALAARAFGAAALGDPRRTARAVALGAALFREPAASLPRQAAALPDLRAAYNLLARPEVTHAALQAPHWAQTRAGAGSRPLTLLVRDTTRLDYTGHRAVAGLGPIGDGGGRGLLLQSVLAVTPAPREVLGPAYQEPYRRVPAPPGDTSSRRRRRGRESGAWPRAAAAVGAPPPGARWVHVGDAYGDMYDFLEACRAAGCDFLVRACQDRRVLRPDGAPGLLLSWARSLPPAGERPLDLPARPARQGRPARPARVARLRVAFGAVTPRPPAHGGRGRPELDAWVARVWEPEAPAGCEPLEWVLVTSAPVQTERQARERSEWYRCRWLVEDYHQCLKTGCAVERRQLQTAAGLERLLGLLGVAAVWLLQLREWSRLGPGRPAAEAAPADLVRVVGALSGRDPSGWSAQDFWRALAGLGGYLGRKRDGPPGWKTVWHGWRLAQTVLTGVRLADELRL